jgi:signal transduction histidine kinase
MKKKLLAICIFLTVSSAAQQKKEIDSLLQLLDKATADTTRLNLNRRIGNFYMDNNAGKAIEYFMKVQDLAKKLNLPLQLANSYYSTGFCYLVKGDYDKSLANYQQSIRIYETLKDTFRLSNALMSVGNVYSSNNNFQKVNEYYEKAQALVEVMKDSVQLSSIYSERGNILNQQKKYDSALVYQQKALHIARLMKDQYLISNTYVNIGLTYKHLNQINQSLAYYDSAAAIYNATETPIDIWAAFYNNIASTYSQAGNYAKAKEAFDQSIAYALKAGSPAIEMENYRNMADMYEHMKDYRLQSLYQKKYYTLKDSLFSTDNKNQLTQLEADYQVEKKNAEIVKKDAEVILQKSQRNIFIIIAVAALLLVGTLFLSYRRIRQSNFLLKEKNEQIHKQKDELQSLNSIKDRLFSIISHDLRNPLVTLKSYLTLSNNSSLTPEKKEQFKNQTFQAVTQTGNMLDNLLAWANLQLKNTAPAVTMIDVTDLVHDAVSDVKAQADQKQISIQVHTEVEHAAGNEQILSIALRNLLTNAIKYSHEKGMIQVSSFSRDSHTCLSVKDEGCGMTEDQLNRLMNNSIDTTKGTGGEKGSGLGLFLVKELLQKINGKLLIESGQGKGSLFTVMLPA